MAGDLAARWKEVSRLLDEALDLPAAERAAWLANLPPEHAESRPHLERLLRQHDTGTDLSLADALPGYRSDEADEPDRQAGDELGPWRLVREIGRGGMGAVWLAERAAGGAKMPVALKMLHPFASKGPQAERFRREREILASLNHPNIARLIDAGVTEEGVPWLALEYVEGGTLIDWCNSRGTGLEARLALYAQALKAVQYAHANLVIHRDLKPGNILVTPTGEVKLLDFGIAKLLDREERRTNETELTRLAGRAMTPHYASPEQIAGLPLTTASDVYSLGVVLFELLTGSRPYRLKRGSAAELEEAILAADTAMPSASVTDVFARRLATPSGRLRRTLRGDLDTIVMKALAKRPEDRYGSVEAFAQDLERYREGLPVLARRESAAYRLAKFVRRHRLAVAAAGAVTLALVGGLVAALWQADLARQSARVAEAEARKAKAVQGFLVDLFARNSREQAQAAKARDTTVRELLVQSADRLPAAFDDSPPLKLELLVTVGRLLVDVEEVKRAADLFAKADETATKAGLKGSDLHVDALAGLAESLRMTGRGQEGLQARERGIGYLDARGDRDSLLRARLVANPSSAATRDVDKERKRVGEVIGIFAAKYPEHPSRYLALATAGHLERASGNLKGAYERFLEAEKVFAATGSRDFTSLGNTHAWAAFCAFRIGKIAESLAQSETGLALLDEHAGKDSQVTRFHRGLRAEVLHRAGREAEAYAIWESLRKVGAGKDQNATDFNNAIYEADARLRDGEPKRAVALLEPYAANHARFGAQFFPNGVHWATLLAHARFLTGDAAGAEAALARVKDVPQNFTNPAEQMVQYVLDVSAIRLAQGRLDDAWKVLTVEGGKLYDDYGEFSMYYVLQRVRAAEIALARKDRAAAGRYVAEAKAHLRRDVAPGVMPFLDEAVERVERAAG
ncbi:MAG: serine/threonine protein kinase [Betaproteobacteria bacterium]|nr:serine/threonine protein kinase [Betaproteobacteria bacterium]